MASPIFNWSGEVSLASGTGGAGDCGASAEVGANAAFTTRALEIAPPGMIGVVEATSPKLDGRTAVVFDASGFDWATEIAALCFAVHRAVH